jgi:hypothetical protein
VVVLEAGASEPAALADDPVVSLESAVAAGSLGAAVSSVADGLGSEVAVGSEVLVGSEVAVGSEVVGSESVPEVFCWEPVVVVVVGSGSELVGSGSELVGSGSVVVGSGSEVIGSGSVVVGSGSEVVGFVVGFVVVGLVVGLVVGAVVKGGFVVVDDGGRIHGLEVPLMAGMGTSPSSTCTGRPLWSRTTGGVAWNGMLGACELGRPR